MKKGMTLPGKYWMLYLIPALLFYILFMAYPLLDSLKLSFFSGNATGPRTFVGFDNFITLFTDSEKSALFRRFRPYMHIFCDSYAGSECLRNFICGDFN